ncbi:MAG: hypothetical protein ABIN91_08070 [Mucilaginibacter sp.]|uniref:hypothetical protein n=1 Tax=Mucilaginibacter sp. TaxID=1882438 RepID=UPI00326315E7
MSFYDKYPQLKQKQFLHDLLSKTVYATMALEDQTVSMQDIERIVSSAIKKEELQRDQLFFN